VFLCCITFLLRVTHTERRKLAIYAECHYAKCRKLTLNAECELCQYAKCHYAGCHGANFFVGNGGKSESKCVAYLPYRLSAGFVQLSVQGLHLYK